MSRKLREKLERERSEYWDTAETLLKKQEQGEELADGELTTLAEAQKAAAGLTPRIEELMTYEESRLAAARRDAEMRGLYESVKEPAAPREPELTSLGTQFTASSQFADFKERGGGPGDNRRRGGG